MRLTDKIVVRAPAKQVGGETLFVDNEMSIQDLAPDRSPLNDYHWIEEIDDGRWSFYRNHSGGIKTVVTIFAEKSEAETRLCGLILSQAMENDVWVVGEKDHRLEDGRLCLENQ